TACCDRHADGTNRLALVYVNEDGATTRTTFDEVAEMSRRFANVLKADGLTRGGRVAVFLSQSLELPIAHLAAFRSGMISIPLFALFGEDALEFRLSNSGAKAIITDESGWEKLTKIRDRLPYLQDIYITSGAVHAGAKPFWTSIETASEEFATVDTSADDPALKLMRIADVRHPGVKLRSIFTGGESLGSELLDWVRLTFGIDAHEVFGQTECNLVIGSNAKLFPIRPGSMGKATPGFDVRIV